MRLKKIHILLAFGALFVLLSIGTALTKRPWSDEGWFAAAGYNLAFHGQPGTLVLVPRGFREGLDRYTYWTAPLYYPLQAVWYWLCGFSLVSMRLLSTVFGALYLVSWAAVARRLTRSETAGVLVFALLATDYIVVNGSTFGRMDIVCAGLGAAALAVYLWRRERNLTQAVVLSQTLLVLSGVTHYLGILYFFALAILTLYFDRRRLTLRHLALAAIPYAVAAAAWGVYIAQEPQLFVRQFFGNASDTTRMSGFKNPPLAFYYEITGRYLKSYGLGPHSAGTSGPVYLKSLTLAAFAFGLLTMLFVRRLRTNPLFKPLIYIWAVFFVVLTVLDGQKLSYYLLHIIPLYVVFLAIAIVYWRRRTKLPGWLAALALAGLIALPTGGLLLKMKADDYGRSYGQAAEYLRRNAREGEKVMASTEMAFALGFDGRVVDDHWLGYEIGVKPAFFVVEEVYEEALEGKITENPPVYRFVQETLARDYELVYDRHHYKIYALKGRPGSASNAR